VRGAVACAPRGIVTPAIRAFAPAHAARPGRTSYALGAAAWRASCAGLNRTSTVLGAGADPRRARSWRATAPDGVLSVRARPFVLAAADDAHDEQVAALTSSSVVQ